MTLFTTLTLALGVALLASLPKLRPQEDRMAATIRYPQLTRVLFHLGVLPVGELRPTPDTVHHEYLERNGLREIRVSRAGQTIERRTFPAGGQS